MRNLNIRNRMLILILGINLFTLMIIFLVYFNFSRKIIVKETKTKAMEKVKGVAFILEGYLNEKARIGWTFCQNPIFVDWLKKNDQRLLKKKDDPVYSMLTDYGIDLVENDGDIDNVFYASEKNQMYYNQIENYSGEDYYVGTRGWYKDVVEKGVPVWDVDVDYIEKITYVNYRYPIYDQGKQLLGVGGIDITLEKFTKFISDLDNVFETGQAFLVGKDGTILSHPDEAYVLKKKLTDFPDDGKLYSNMNAFSEKLLEGGSGIGEVVFDGDNRYFIYTSIPDLGWTLVLSVSVKEVNAPVRNLIKNTVLIIIITSLFLIIAVVFITGSISKPIKHLIEMIRDVAEGEGDLTQRIAIDTKDETGELAYWFNKFFDNIHNIVKNVVANAEEVVKASNVISTTSNKMDQGAQEQANRTANIASSTKEMINTITEVTQIYNQAVNIVKKAAEKAESGREIVNKSVEGMSKISETVENSQLTIEELGTRSAEIGKIVRVIDAIANQTNLLALNAAIEASGAGEHGRGFAVVAEDVRQLADRTTQATKEIGVMIQSIQDDTRKAVKSMQEGNAELEAGTELVNNSGAVLKDIVKTVDEVQCVISEMANASEQLTLASDEISNNITDISTVTGSTAENTRELSVISTQLNNQAEGLRVLVKRFKIK